MKIRIETMEVIVDLSKSRADMCIRHTKTTHFSFKNVSREVKTCPSKNMYSSQQYLNAAMNYKCMLSVNLKDQFAS